MRAPMAGNRKGAFGMSRGVLAVTQSSANRKDATMAALDEPVMRAIRIDFVMTDSVFFDSLFIAASRAR